MTDNNDNNNNDVNNRFPHLTAEQVGMAEKAIEKKNNIKLLKSISPADSKWTLLQEIMQEIQSTHMIQNPDTPPRVTAMMQELRDEVNSRYENDDTTRTILVNAIPSEVTIRAWLKADGWNEAVWAKAKDSGLFSKERRAAMINALFTRGVLRSDTAAKLYLTMSGDYSEKADGESNRVADTFREINKILHKKS